MQPPSHPPRSSARPWFAALLAFAIVFSWLALASPDEAEDAPASRQVDAPAPQPTAAAAPPEAALTKQHREAPAMPEPVVPSAQESPTEPAAPAAQAEPAEPGPIAPDTRGFFVDAIVEHYERDSRDGGAARVESELQAFMRERELPAGGLRSVVCRKAICKLELYWRAEYDAPYRSALDDLANGNAKAVATRAEAPDKHGGVAVEVYWMRSIGTLPERAK